MPPTTEHHYQYLKDVFVNGSCIMSKTDGGEAAHEFLEHFLGKMRIESILGTIFSMVALMGVTMLGGIPPPVKSIVNRICWGLWMGCMSLQLLSTLLALLFTMLSFAVFRADYGDCLTRLGPKTSVAYGASMACPLTILVAKYIQHLAICPALLGSFTIPRYLGGDGDTKFEHSSCARTRPLYYLSAGILGPFKIPRCCGGDDIETAI
jgi:hypothetical protein